MYGLPKTTEIGHKQIPKKAIYEEYKLKNKDKELFDNDISKIYLDNEITPMTVNLPEGESVKSFYVVSVILKQQDFNEKNIVLINKLIKQNILLVLTFNEKIKLVVCLNDLIYQTEWTDKININLTGLSIDNVWENIVSSIACFKIERGRTLNEQIKIELIKKKLNKQIKILENKRRFAKQPNFKQNFHREIIKLKKKLSEIQ